MNFEELKAEMKTMTIPTLRNSVLMTIEKCEDIHNKLLEEFDIRIGKNINENYIKKQDVRNAIDEHEPCKKDCDCGKEIKQKLGLEK